MAGAEAQGAYMHANLPRKNTSKWFGKDWRSLLAISTYTIPEPYNTPKRELQGQKQSIYHTIQVLNVPTTLNSSPDVRWAPYKPTWIKISRDLCLRSTDVWQPSHNQHTPVIAAHPVKHIYPKYTTKICAESDYSCSLRTLWLATCLYVLTRWPLLGQRTHLPSLPFCNAPPQRPYLSALFLRSTFLSVDKIHISLADTCP